MTTAPALVVALTSALTSFDPAIGVRLVGVSVANFVEPVEQMSLFDATDDAGPDVSAMDRKWSPASRAVDAIRDRFGHDAIAPAGSVRRTRSSPWGPNAETRPEAEE